MPSHIHNNRLLSIIFFIVVSMFLSAEEPSGPTPKKEIASSAYTLSGTLVFVSDYRSRGVSQTLLEPAIQGEFKYVHRSGVYAKTWASNVDGTGNLIGNSSMEWDFYLGITQKIADTSFTYDIGLEYYWYPGGEAHVPKRVSYNTLEYYVGFTYKNFEFKITQTLTDYFGFNSANPPANWDTKRRIKPNGHSYHSPYLEANYNWTINAKWFAAFHVAYQGITNYSALGYVDWSATIARTFDWFTVSLAYVQTNAKKAFYNIPNSAFKPHRKWLGGPTAVLSAYRNF